jgi:elongation factor Ts
MNISAQLVKELRERSGAGMMECKKALAESGGDLDAAIEYLRKQGLAKADKKASRIAAEGRIALAASGDGRRAVLVEVNCETDFVGKDESFVRFAERVAQAALDADTGDIERIRALPLDGQTVEEARQALVARIGENIQVRRAARLEGPRVGHYLHGSRIGVLLALEGGDESLARDLAMHVAALKPAWIALEAVPPEVLAKEREIALAQVKDSGKPPEILEKMVEGKVRKALSEQTLLGQVFVKGDGKETVGDLLRKRGGKVLGFVRIEVGEGVEKKADNFAEEVMKQAGLA